MVSSVNFSLMASSSRGLAIIAFDGLDLLLDPRARSGRIADVGIENDRQVLPHVGRILGAHVYVVSATTRQVFVGQIPRSADADGSKGCRKDDGRRKIEHRQRRAKRLDDGGDEETIVGVSVNPQLVPLHDANLIAGSI